MNRYLSIFSPCFLIVSSYLTVGLFLSCRKSGDNSDNLRTRQDSVGHLAVDEYSISLSDTSGAADTLSISSNVSWAITISPANTNWLSVDPISGSNDNKVILRSIAGNTADSSRSVVLKIAASDTSVQPVEVIVSQNAKIYTVNGLDTREKFIGNLYFVDNNLNKPNPSGSLVKMEQYFSSVNSSTSTFNEYAARKFVKDVDIVYFGVPDYSEIGFIDPYTASQVWYWDYVYKPWLDSSVKTLFYNTTLTKAEFDLAKGNLNKLNQYFSDTISFQLATNPIYPLGACLGGRNSPQLKRGSVYGFKNEVSGKKGLIYIRTGQSQYWDLRLWVDDNGTAVDIIKEK